MNTVFQIIGGIIGGGLLTLLVAHYYYERAARELRAEATRLRHLTTLILRALEDKGLAKLARDSAGEITGLQFELNASPGVYGVSGADADLKAKRDDAAV